MHAQTQDHALRVVAKLPEDEVPDGDLALPIKAVVIKQVHEGTRLLSTRVTIMAWHGREWRCGCCTSTTRAREPVPTIWRVPDDLWARMAPILAELDPPKPTGRRRINARAVADAIIFRLASRVSLESVPRRLP